MWLTPRLLLNVEHSSIHSFTVIYYNKVFYELHWEKCSVRNLMFLYFFVQPFRDLILKPGDVKRYSHNIFFILIFIYVTFGRSSIPMYHRLLCNLASQYICMSSCKRRSKLPCNLNCTCSKGKYSDVVIYKPSVCCYLNFFFLLVSGLFDLYYSLSPRTCVWSSTPIVFYCGHAFCFFPLASYYRPTHAQVTRGVMCYYF